MSDIFNYLFQSVLSSGLLTLRQLIIIMCFFIPVGAVVWKIRNILSFFNEVRNSKLKELKYLKDEYDLSDEIKSCIKEDIERLVTYRLTGIHDIPRQKIILRLLLVNKNKIPIDFFNKFKSYLVVKDGVLYFNKGLSFYIERIMYSLFSLQSLFISIFSVYSLEVHWHDPNFLCKKTLLSIIAIAMFVSFIIFTRVIVGMFKIKLLGDILKSQVTNI